MQTFPAAINETEPNALVPHDDPAFAGEDIALDGAISKVLAELGDDSTEASVHVSRIVEGKPKGVFCDEYSPSEFSLKRLAQDFGGGAYRVMVFVPRFEIRGDVRKKVGVSCAKNQRVEIDGPPRTPSRSEPETVQASTPALDPAALVREIAEQLRLAQPQQQTFREKVEEMRMMREAFAPAAPAEKPRDTLAEFLNFLTVQEKLKERLPKPPSGDDGGLMALAGVAGEIISMIRNAAGANAGMVDGEQPPQLPAPGQQPPANPPPAREAQPGPRLVQQPPQPPQVSEEEQAMHIMYAGYVTLLVAKARRGDAVKDIAEEIYDQLPDQAFDWILNDPNYIETLAKFNKDVPLFRAWFDQLRAELVRLDQEENGKPAA